MTSLRPDHVSVPRAAPAALSAAAMVVLAVLGLATAAVLAPAGAQAQAAPLQPPGKKIFFGVTDTGTEEGFKGYARAVGRYPAVIQTFHPWGNSLDKSLPRWQALRARPMLHINTMNDEGEELIKPRGIAFGGGDEYLLYLNDILSETGTLAYIRPLGEPNRCLNAYAALDCLGNRRSNHYAHRWYKKAFQRMYLILHGGMPQARLDRRLGRLGLPPLKPRQTAVPRVLPKAPIAVIWSTLPGGSPKARGNFPGDFWPGARYTDWVGTDFYSKYPHWRDLNRFYRNFARKRRMPLALTEWGIWGADAPRFTRQLFTWMERRHLAKMMVYYQDFGESNEFRIQNYPDSRAVITRRINSRRYPQRAPNPPRAPRPEPETGGMTPVTAQRAAIRRGR